MSHSPYSSKAAAARAIMKNKDTAKYILDMFDAPAGSTKNKIASKLLRATEKSLNKGKNDGRGGIYDPYQPQATTSLQSMQPGGVLSNFSLGASGNAEITPQAPPPQASQLSLPQAELAASAPAAAPQPTVLAKSIDDLLPVLRAGGAGIKLGPGGMGTPYGPPGSPVTQAPMAGASRFRFGPGQVPQQIQPFQQQSGLPSTGARNESAAGTVYAGAPTFDQRGTNAGPVTQAAFTEQRTGRKFTQGEADVVFRDCVISGTNVVTCVMRSKEQTGIMPNFGNVIKLAGELKGTTPAGVQYGPEKPPTEPGAGFAGEGPQGQEDLSSLAQSYGPSDVWAMVESAISNGNGEDITAWFTALEKTNPTLANQWRPIYNAISSGAGSGSALLSVLSNPEQLSATLGIPKEVIDRMPFDIIGGPKLAQLKDIAKKQFDIDSLTAQLMNRQTTHLYADQNFRSYIRGKDQLLGKVDRMIDEFGVQMEGMDLSDPYLRDRVKTYQNYLTNVKGSTEKRYMDVLQDSISLESADYERFNTFYQSQVNEANNSYNQLVSNATASWQTMLPLMEQSITGMYDSLEKRKNGNAEALKSQLDLIKTAATLANDLALAPYILTGQQTEADIKAQDLLIKKEQVKQEQQKTTTGGKTLSPASLQDINNELYSIKPGDKDFPEGKLRALNPFQLYDIAAKNFSNPLSIIDVYGPALSKDIASAIGQGRDPSSVIAPLLASVGATESYLSLDTVANLNDDQKLQIADSYTTAIKKGVARGVRGLLVDNATDVQKFVTDLYKNRNPNSTERASPIYKMIAEAEKTYVPSAAAAGAFEGVDVGRFGWTKEEYNQLLSQGSEAIAEEIAAIVAMAALNKTQ